DLELADAIRRAGNVVLSASFQMIWPDDPPPREAARAYLRDEPDATAQMLAKRVGLPEDEATKLWLVARLVPVLLEQFDLTDAQLAANLKQSPNAIRLALVGAKHDAVMGLAANFLATSPDGTADQFVARVLPGLPTGTINPDTEALRDAF